MRRVRPAGYSEPEIRQKATRSRCLNPSFWFLWKRRCRSTQTSTRSGISRLEQTPCVRSTSFPPWRRNSTICRKNIRCRLSSVLATTTLRRFWISRAPAEQLDAGRITTPADSVLGITVGAISHVDYKKNGPKEHHPSAFSRHGAGPNYVIKPDLVHYGGSCSTDLSHISGIRSVNNGGSAENLGTSFATPLVSRTLAQIYHQITPTPSPVLARALLTHHARDPRTKQRVPDGDENFFGFGLAVSRSVLPRMHAIHLDTCFRRRSEAPLLS